MAVKSKISGLLKHLHQGLYEKEEILALTLLSSLAGESVFLLGPPGVAKSLIARRLKYAYTEGKAFEYLMNQFSTPDEIFGPVSIAKLKDQDKYERITDSYLPGAEVVFLDEIWKAGPSIQNALLTVLNERVYRNGEQEIPVPMKALMAASNELPLKGQGLEALWDRFLVRIPVGGIEDPHAFKAMISQPLDGSERKPPEKYQITPEEYQLWSRRIDRIRIPEYVFNLIILFKTQYKTDPAQHGKKPVPISDRRWKKIVRLLRTSAFLNDRKAVDLADCFLMSYCLWNEPEELPQVSQFIQELIQKHGYLGDFDRAGLREALAEFQGEIAQETRWIQDTRETVLKVYNQYYYRILTPEDPHSFIKRQDFDRLSTQEQPITLFARTQAASGYLGKNRSSLLKQGVTDFSMVIEGVASDLEYLFTPGHILQVSKGSQDLSIRIDDKEWELEKIVKGDKRRITRKPGGTLIAAWDKQIARFLGYTGEWKAQLEKYQNQDLKQLQVNLFVKPALGGVVASHLTAGYQEIDKLEVEIREIQHRYRQIQDEEAVL